MKKLSVLIISLFLLSLSGCTSTTQDAASPSKQKEAPFGLTGSWVYSGVVEADTACGGNKTENWTVEISQTGSTVKLKQKFGMLTGKRSGNTISFPEFISGKLTIKAAKYQISADENTLTAKDMNWTWGTCGGVSNSTFKRKTPVAQKKSAPSSLSGSWIYARDVRAGSGCGGNKTENWAVEISQMGKMVMVKQKFGLLTGKRSGHIISFPEFKSGKLTIEATKYKVSADEKKLSAKDSNWIWDKCEGVSNVTYKRK
jgi:hypothetical protein